MSLVQEFKAFVAKGNVVDLAIAVVVGGAFGEIVKAFVNGIVMPLVSYVMPANMVWEQWTLGKLRIGLVLGATLNFLIIAGVVFLVLVKALAIIMRKKEEAPAPDAPPTKTCPECLETIPAAATRCKFCTSKLEG
ncbi:large conductance mechanosensitive channel protein MscL [Mesoterricola sediminis]|uniref:Large-conductance mechanosensitive channel n=1 Tax=Mesoterricola sediminis TaxID=2927980 RepID=A0AA48H1Z3_9BACT|nr:large conductance mechanosensitive channel protein MscL [Mesoterricola sediminis]BDU76006.1 large-conductance mechanosensitive channel [Mesoterricola sediminis]